MRIAAIEDAGTYGMIGLAVLLAVMVALPHLAPDVFGQIDGVEPGGATIEIMPDTPCWLNSTHPHRIMQNCMPQGDWIGFVTSPWEYVTGGLLSMMIVSVLVLVVWAKYRQAIYPIFIGVVMLPISFFLFPNEFLSFAVLLTAIGVGAYIWWAITRQTE